MRMQKLVFTFPITLLNILAMFEVPNGYWKLSKMFRTPYHTKKLLVWGKILNISWENEEKLLTYMNIVKHIACPISIMKVTVVHKEIKMTLLNAISIRFEIIDLAVEDLAKLDKLITLGYKSSRPLQEEKPFKSQKLWDNKAAGTCKASTLLRKGDHSFQGWILQSDG